MWQEVYYEHYVENCRGLYWEEEKQLPYSVKCKSVQEKEQLEQLLRFDGFKCVGSSDSIALLINLKLKKYCGYPKAVTMSCISNRSFSVENFLAGIYNPWYANQKYGTKLEDMEVFKTLKAQTFIKYNRNQGMSDEQLLEKLSCHF